MCRKSKNQWLGCSWKCHIWCMLDKGNPTIFCIWLLEDYANKSRRSSCFLVVLALFAFDIHGLIDHDSIYYFCKHNASENIFTLALVWNCTLWQKCSSFWCYLSLWWGLRFVWMVEKSALVGEALFNNCAYRLLEHNRNELRTFFIKLKFIWVSFLVYLKQYEEVIAKEMIAWNCYISRHFISLFIQIMP